MGPSNRSCERGPAVSAPALVLLAPGSTDPHVTSVAHELRRQLQTMRPEIPVHVAFLDQCPPTGPQVVQTLVGRGHEEIVLVPLQLSTAVASGAASETLLHRVRAAHPGTSFAMARPVGPSPSLLTVVDERLRAAVSGSRTLELDGLVLLAEGGADRRGQALLARRVRQWSTHHKLPCVTAVGDGSGPDMGSAIASLRAQGRRHIAVGSLVLAADEQYVEQAQIAVRLGAVAVGTPVGCHRELLDLILARYAYAAMELLHFDIEDEVTAAV